MPGASYSGDMRLSSGIEIDDACLTFRFVRASGPGGQNVNKVASAAELRFDLAACPNLAPAVKARLVRLAGRRITREGTIVIDAQEHRTQEANRRAALDRLSQMVAAALVEPKRRRPTKPTKGSQARRLQSKQVASRHKASRAKVDRHHE